MENPIDPEAELVKHILRLAKEQQGLPNLIITSPMKDTIIHLAELASLQQKGRLMV